MKWHTIRGMECYQCFKAITYATSEHHCSQCPLISLLQWLKIVDMYWCYFVDYDSNVTPNSLFWRIEFTIHVSLSKTWYLYIITTSLTKILGFSDNLFSFKLHRSTRLIQLFDFYSIIINIIQIKICFNMYLPNRNIFIFSILDPYRCR